MKHRALCPILLILLTAATASGQAQPALPAQASARAFEIIDNSFLVEEAFNQERGIVQNILAFSRSRDSGWTTTFTQEWPAPGQRHQLSYTLPYSGADGVSGLGDVLINYRYQATVESAKRPAFSPRLSVVLPTGSERKGLGYGVLGLQVNLPFSKQVDDLYLHLNAGLTYWPGVDASTQVGQSVAATPATIGLLSPQLAASAILRVRPMVNLIFEAVAASDEFINGAGSSAREMTITLSPGIRGGWNIGDTQLILGVAVPLGLTNGEVDPAILSYVSYELPFHKK
jgi:hypothetical protein